VLSSCRRGSGPSLDKCLLWMVRIMSVVRGIFCRGVGVVLHVLRIVSAFPPFDIWFLDLARFGDEVYWMLSIGNVLN